eukprot:jgi/Orpsp1_1/1186514/evm.model.d7180000051136.1
MNTNNNNNNNINNNNNNNINNNNNYYDDDIYENRNEGKFYDGRNRMNQNNQNGNINISYQPYKNDKFNMNNSTGYNIDCYNIKTDNSKEQNYSRRISININERNTSKTNDKYKGNERNKGQLNSSNKIRNSSWDSSDGSNTDDTIVMNNSNSQTNIDSNDINVISDKNRGNNNSNNNNNNHKYKLKNEKEKNNSNSNNSSRTLISKKSKIIEDNDNSSYSSDDEQIKYYKTNNNKNQKIYPQSRKPSKIDESEQKVKINKKLNKMTSQQDNDITYFNNKNFTNQNHQEEYIHNNINNNSKKIQREIKMVCAVNRTNANTDNPNKITDKNNTTKIRNKIDNSNNYNSVAFESVEYINNNDNKTNSKSVNFAPIECNKNSMNYKNNLNSISPINQRKIKELKIRNYRPLPPKKENTNSDYNEDDFRVIRKDKPTKTNNEIEFEEIDSFEEIQRSINSCENEQIKNQQYLNYMNNINANLNLPSIPTNQSLEVNEDLIELDDTNNDLDENFEIASSSKNHNRKRTNSKSNSSIQ